MTQHKGKKERQRCKCVSYNIDERRGVAKKYKKQNQIVNSISMNMILPLIKESG